MSEYVNVTNRDILAFTLIVITMLGFLVYGLILVNKPASSNCWSQYTTETAAIQACENHN